MDTPLNNAAITFLVVAMALLILLPRKWAFVPLVAGACYITQGQVIDFGSFTFTFLRLLTLVGILRVCLRGERLAAGILPLDWIFLSWALWLPISSFVRGDVETHLIRQLGELFDACGLYFLVRVFCGSLQESVRVIKTILIVLVPVGLSMIYETATMRNPFAVLGGVEDVPMVREGRVRASGPFRHPILAGTVGAVAVPMAVSLWHTNRFAATLGCAAPLTMVLASGSSGPIMTLMAALVGLYMWPLRKNMALIRKALVVGYVAVDLVMQAPAYFLLARIDITGGSTGHHRAALIQSSVNHLSEWWLAGTNYTRHWMVTGVTWSPDHVDITNQYIVMGVKGGLMSMILYIAMIVVGFSLVGSALAKFPGRDRRTVFPFWALGSTLFAHTVTFVSVSYFDQSRFFFYLLLAVIGSAAGSYIALPTLVSSDQPEARTSCWKIDQPRMQQYWFQHKLNRVPGLGRFVE